MSSTPTIRNYQDYVDRLASKGENEVFFNSGPVHAAIVMSRIFKHSKSIVRIYSGGFNGVVSNDADYLNYLTQFLDKKGKVEVLIEKDLSQTNAKIYDVFRKYCENADLRLTSKRIVDSSTNKPLHFAVGDDKMYRIETGTENYTAQVNFGDQDTSLQYISLFDSIFRESKKITLA